MKNWGHVVILLLFDNVHSSRILTEHILLPALKAQNVHIVGNRTYSKSSFFAYLSEYSLNLLVGKSQRDSVAAKIVFPF